MLFMQMVGLGAAAGSLYDVFRVLRVTFKHPNVLIQLEDLLYWVMVTFGVFYFALNVNNGDVRVFMIVGIALGVVIYFLTVSVLFIKMAAALLNLSKNIVLLMFRIFLWPVKTLLYFLSFPYRALRRLAKHVGKPVKKYLQRYKLCVKIRKKRIKNHLRMVFKVSR